MMSEILKIKKFSHIIAHMVRCFDRSKLERVYGFAQQGAGIRRRLVKHAKAWEHHRKNSITAQKIWWSKKASPNETESKPISTLVVLGAGTLWDFAVDSLPAPLKEVYLVDIDRKNVNHWNRASLLHKKELHHLLEDATGVFSKAVSDLRKLCIKSKSVDEFLNAIEQYRFQRAGHSAWQMVLQHAPSAGVLSLNLLSQLPLFWTKACERMLIKRFGHRAYRRISNRLLTSLIPSQQSLVHAHYQDMQSASETGPPSTILLITDQHYIEYFVNSERPKSRKDSLPIKIGPSGKFEILDVELEPKLEITHALTFDSIEDSLPEGWTCTDIVSPWLWHIVPASQAGKSGWVHYVRAVEIRPA